MAPGSGGGTSGVGLTWVGIYLLRYWRPVSLGVGASGIGGGLWMQREGPPGVGYTWMCLGRSPSCEGANGWVSLRGGKHLGGLTGRIGKCGAWMGLQKEDQTSKKGKGSLWENNNPLFLLPPNSQSLEPPPGARGLPPWKSLVSGLLHLWACAKASWQVGSPHPPLPTPHTQNQSQLSCPSAPSLSLGPDGSQV